MRKSLISAQVAHTEDITSWQSTNSWICEGTCDIGLGKAVKLGGILDVRIKKKKL